MTGGGGRWTSPVVGLGGGGLFHPRPSERERGGGVVKVSEKVASTRGCQRQRLFFNAKPEHRGGNCGQRIPPKIWKNCRKWRKIAVLGEEVKCNRDLEILVSLTVDKKKGFKIFKSRQGQNPAGNMI